MFLHTWHPHPILFSIGGLHLHWYGLLLAGGAVAGFMVVSALARRYHLPENHITNLFFFFLVFGLIGARLWHVSNEWAYYQLHPGEIIKIWNGGLGLHGGIIAGIIVLWLYSQMQKLNGWLFADILVPGLVLAQAIGRWGNYFNQELFGRPTNLPWGIPIDPINRPLAYQGSQFFHPTFLYESLGNFIIFLILIGWHLHRLRLKRDQNAMAKFDVEGAIALSYFGLYSVLRILTESLRIDHTPVVGGLRLPVITSIVIIVLAVTTWFILRWRVKKNYGSH